MSVPVWLAILSDQLTIVALVGRYLTNKLMVRGLLFEQKLTCRGPLWSQVPWTLGYYPVLAPLS